MNYYRRYLGDYMRDTMHLSIVEHGAYTLLLDAYYASEKPLPVEYDALYRVCRAMSGQEKEAVKLVADRFFPVKDGARHNPRANREIAVAQSTIEKQRKSGVDSAAKRWGTDTVNDESTDRSSIQPPTTNHHPSTTTPQKRAEARSRGSRLPPEWQPSEILKAWAEKERPDLDLRVVVEMFKNHWAAKPGKDGCKLDWEATFRNWVLKEKPGTRRAAIDHDRLAREIEEEDRKRAAH